MPCHPRCPLRLLSRASSWGERRIIRHATAGVRSPFRFILRFAGWCGCPTAPALRRALPQVGASRYGGGCVRARDFGQFTASLAGFRATLPTSA